MAVMLANLNPPSVVTVSILLLCASCFSVCQASWNLYLDQSEVRSLLGLQAELYYVREGIINSYALNFVVPVPAQINTLHFTWQSLDGQPLPYEITFHVSNNEALATPVLNISASGNIPSIAKTFQVALPCTGLQDAQVDVTINMVITAQKNNDTSLIFKRKKICLKENHHVVVVDTTQQEDDVTSSYIAVGCACALLATLVLFTTCYYVRNSKAQRQEALPRESRHGSTISQGPNASLTYPSGSVSSYTLLDERAHKEIHERISELTITRSRVRVGSVILEGTFGRVYRGFYTQPEGPEIEVLIKTVTDHASQVQISLLLQEGMAMYSLNHKNVLSVLGVSIQDHTAPFLIYPFDNHNNLKQYLRECRDNINRVLTTREIVAMAIQLVQGLQYLHRRHLTHKDVATRNCMIHNNHILITDNALSRDIFPNDYHCLGDNDNRPIKWLAHESLTSYTFNTSSDVWSFGVLLWELTTLAQQPYAEIDPFEIVAYLQDGYRLAQPVNCPDELFAMMAYCWAMSPSERPTFGQLQTCLQDFNTQLTRYV